MTDSALENTCRRLGLFGGTFDPFHMGHRAMVQRACRELALDRLLVMPVGRPPHKDRRISFAAYRYEMACRGSCDLDQVTVSDQEIRTPGLDYTYHTVLELKELYRPEELFLIAGSDVLLSLDRWYRPEDLLQEVTLAVGVRGGDDSQAVLQEVLAVEKHFGCRVRLLDLPPLELSSSLLRDRLDGGEAVDDLCPPAVVSFLDQFKPYAFKAVFDLLSPLEWDRLLALEEAAWPFSSQARRLHAASVAQYAARLAQVYGQPVLKAAAAGLLHDLAKELPRDRQLQAAASCQAIPGLGGDELTDDLLHGPASALLALELWGEEDRELLESIAWHPTAHPRLSVLGQILYLADKISYDRTFMNLAPIREAAEGGRLALAMKLCLEEVFKALEGEGKQASPISLEAHTYFAGQA